jgi:hypothetical protein
LQLVKKLQRAGQSGHGNTLSLKKPAWAKKFHNKFEPRVPGEMARWMFYHEQTMSFPLYQDDGSCDNKKNEGLTFVSPDEKSISDKLREKLDREITMRKKLEKQVLTQQKRIRMSVKETSTNRAVDDQPGATEPPKRPPTKKRKPVKMGENPKSNKAKKPKANRTKKTDQVTGTQENNAVLEVFTEVARDLPPMEVAPEVVEEEEEFDEFETVSKCGRDGTKIMGSTIKDGKLLVYLEWDGDPKKMTLDAAEDVFQDFPWLFEDIKCPPRMNRFLATKKRPFGKKPERKKEIPAITPEKPRFVCEHNNLGSLRIEENSGYCNVNCYLHLGKCDVCSVSFVGHKIADNEWAPSTSTPVWICPVYSNKSGNCSFALCGSCYGSKLDSQPRTRRH